MTGTFSVTPGSVLSILVGQSPGLWSSNYPAGGGGTFVALGSNYATATPLIAAGGGGGAASGYTGVSAPTTTSGTGANPGANGNGATASQVCGGGGGGFLTNGSNDTTYGSRGDGYGGYGFLEGGTGGFGSGDASNNYQPGGFGGGAEADYYATCNTHAGAGGGYSGGSGSPDGAQYYFGQAGGSYNGGTNQTNTAGANNGNGSVQITVLATTTNNIFTNCNATGQYGPTQSACNTAYTGTSLSGAVTVNSGIQQWVAPYTGTYQITAAGASGGYVSGSTPGLGASMAGNFNLTAGTTLQVLVGQSPGLVSGNYSGGGGGTFVAMGSNYATATPLLVAGGGGGAIGSSTGANAPTTTSGTGANPGTNGNGATVSQVCGGGGGGFLTSGSNDSTYGSRGDGYGGYGFRQGGTGGYGNGDSSASYQPGGFGGGAEADNYASCNTHAGAGGGYSGGSGSLDGTAHDFGQAGGSYNGGTNQTNIAGTNNGNGFVQIAIPRIGAVPFSNVTSTQITANWTVSSDPTGTPFNAILSTGSSPSTNHFSGNASSTTTNLYATFSGLNPNTTFYVDVSTSGGIFISLGSTDTFAAAPGTFTLGNVFSSSFTASWSSGSVAAGWNPSGTLYQLLASTNSSLTPVFASTTTSSLSNVALTGLSANTTYFTSVQALGWNGITAAYNGNVSTVTMSIIPSTAAFTNVFASSVTFNWLANGNLAGTFYQVQYSTDPAYSAGVTTTTVFASYPSTSTPITGLSAATMYYFRVQAENWNSIPSGFSVSASTYVVGNSAASAIWIGSGNWSTAANWSGGQVPGGVNMAVFGSASTANCSIDTNIIAAGIQINSGYTGIISDGSSGHTLTVGSSGFTQIGGTFNASTATMTVGGAFSQSGGVFNPNNGTLIANSYANTTLTSSSTLNNLNILYSGVSNTNMVGYWKLDEASGQSFADSSGNGNTGAGNGTMLSSTVAPLSFSNPYSRQFNGNATNYIQLPAATQIQAPLTLSAWVNPSTFNSPGGNEGLFVLAADPGVRLIIDQGGHPQGDVQIATNWQSMLTSPVTIPLNRWSHISFTLDGNRVQTLYVNGAMVASGTVVTGSVNYTTGYPFVIGSDNFNTNPYHESFSGEIDDVRIYGRALSSTEIASLATGQGPVSTATFTLGGNLTLAGNLTISSGTLDVSGSNYTISVAKSWQNNGGSFNAESSTVTFNGSGGTILSGGQSFNGLVFNNVGGSWTANDNLKLSGNWTMTAGTFNGGTSTVTFTGAAPTLTGNTTFYNLAYSVAGGIMTVAQGSTQTITGLLTIQGTSGNVLNVVSSSPGNRWFLKNSGTNSVQYVKAQDSNANAGQMIVDNPGGIDGSGNAHWSFGSLTNFTWTASSPGNWSTAANWQGGVVPGPGNTAIFNSASVQGCTIDISTTVGNLSMGSGYTGTISLNASTLTVTGNFTGGGGVFNGGSGELIVNGIFNGSGGNFIGNAGTVLLGTTLNTTFTPPSSGSFNNFTLGGSSMTPTTSGLVGHWKMDDSGSSIVDYSGSGDNGTTGGTGGGYSGSMPGALTGYVSGSRSFGGSNWVSCGLNNMPAPNASQTISLWYYVSSNPTDNEDFVDMDNGSYGVQFGLRQGPPETLTVWKFGGTALASVAVPVAGSWYHVAYTFDGTTHRLYLGGVWQSSSTMAVGTGAPSELYFGCWGGGGPAEQFKGNLDDIRIYNRALSASEIASLAAGQYVATGTVTLGGNLVVGGNLTVSSGTLDVSVSNYSVSVAKNWQITGGSFTARGSTVTFNGSGGSILSGGQSFKNLVFNNAGGTWTSNDNLTLSGNWTMTAGTYNGGTSTGTFTGTAPTLTGNTTFYNLAYLVAGGTMTVAQGSTQTITGLLTIQGTSVNLLNIVSSSPGSPWFLKNTGTNSVQYVKAQDSNASSGQIITDNPGGIDGSGNVHWSFGTLSNFTWNASGPSSWSTAANWTGGVVPGPNNTAVFNDVSVQPCTVDISTTVANLSIESGYSGTINLNTSTLTVTGNFTGGAGTFDNGSGELIVGGTFNGSGGTFTGNTGTVVLVSTNSVNIAPPSAGGFNNLAFGGPSANGLVGYWKLDDKNSTGTVVDYSGNGNNGNALGFGSGYGYSSGVPAALSGSDGGSRNFDGATSSVTVAPSSSLNLGNVLTICAWIKPNTLSSNCSTGRYGLFSTRSGGAAGAWDLEVGNAGCFPAGASNVVLVAGASTWVYETTNNAVTTNQWQHIAYTRSGTTNQSIYVNGALQAIQNSATFPFSDNANPKTIGENPSGSTFFPGNIDDVRIYNRALTAQEIAALAAGNTATYTLTGGFIVNGNLTLSGGTLIANGNNINVKGNWLNQAGAYNPGANLVTLSGTSSGKSVITNGQPFSSLTVNGAGGYWTMMDPMTLSGPLSIQAGTFDTSISSYSITDSGSFSQTGGTFNLNVSTMSIGGNWSDTAGTFSAGTSTVTFTGTAPSLTGNTTFYNLAYSVAGGTMTVAQGSTQTVTGLLTLQGSSGNNLLNLISSGSGQWYLNNSGTNNVSYVKVQGSNANAGQVIVDNPGGVDGTGNAHWSFGSLANYTWIGSGNWSTASNWSGGAVPGPGNTAVFNSASVQSCTIDISTTVASVAIGSGYAGIISLNTSTLTVTGNFTDGGTFDGGSGELIVGGAFNGSGGNFTGNAGTVVLTSTNSVTFTPPASGNFNNLSLGGPSAGGLVGYWKLDDPNQNGNILDFSGNYSTGTATNFDGAYGYSSSVPTTLSGSDAGSRSFDGSDDYVSLPSGLGQNLTSFTFASWVNWSTPSVWQRIFDFGSGTNVNMFLTPDNGDTFTPRFAITIGGAGAAEQRINAPSALPTGSWHHIAVTLDAVHTLGTMYIDGVSVSSNSGITLTPFSLGATTSNYLGRSQYTVDPYFSGDIDDVRIYNRALSAQEIQALAAGNPPAQTLTGSLTVGGDLTLPAGTLNAAGYPVSVGGSWLDQSGAFTSGGNLVTFNGSGSKRILSNGQSFNSLTLNNVAGTWTPADNLTLTGNWNMTAGVFSGGTSTVTFTGTTQSLTGNTTFYSLAYSVAGGTMTVAQGSTQTVTGLLTLQGTSGNLLNVVSSSPGNQWFLVNSGTNSVSYVKAQDSNARSGNTIIDTLGGIDGTGNANWSFAVLSNFIWTGSGNWSVGSNWLGGVAPGPGNTAVFNGSNNGNCAVNSNINVGGIQISGYTGTINAGGYAVFVGTSGFTQASGTFKAPASTMTVGGIFNQTAGTFNPNNGTLVLNSPSNSTLTSSSTLNNLNITYSGVSNTSLVGYWKLDETSGNTAADSSGNGNNATWENNPVPVTDVAPVIYSDVHSLSFNGINQWVITNNLTAINNSNPFTVSLWFKAAAAGVIVDEIGQTAPNTGWHDSFIEILSNGTVGVRVWNGIQGSGIATSGTASFNTWNHVVMVYNNGTLTGYLNGVAGTPVSVTRQYPAQNSNGEYLAFAVSDTLTNMGSGAYFTGKIDDVRVYSRALSASEIASLAVGQGAAAASTITLGGNLPVGGNLALSSGTLDASVSNYSISVAKSWQNTGGSFNAQSGTVTFNGSGGSILSGGQSFNTLVFNGSGGSWTASDNLSLTGNWAMTAGTFNAGTSTVTFTGVTPYLTGNTTFYNLSCTVAGGTMTFAQGSTQTVTNILTLQGLTGSVLNVVSSSPGSQWFLKNSGTNSVQYVKAQDSNASPGVYIIDNPGGVDGARNIHWSFGPLANFTWVGSGNWSNPANWQGGVVPGVNDTAVFSSASTANCVVDINPTIAALQINSGYSGTITLSNGLTIQGDATLSGGHIDGTTGHSTINVGGSWNNAGTTFVNNAPSVSLNGSTTDKIIATDNQSFYNVTLAAGQQPYALTSGLVGYWKMDESSGSTTVADASSSGNNGTSNSSSNVGSGKYANARTFDGASNYLSLPYNNINFTSASNYSISVWFNTNGNWVDGALYEQTPNTSATYNLDIWIRARYNGHVDFNTGKESVVWDWYTSNGTYNKNGWNNAVLVQNGSTRKIYINGQLDSTHVNSLFSGTNPSGVGITVGRLRRDNDDYFKGSIDDLRVYNRILSDSEISSVYQGGTPGAYTMSSGITAANNLTVSAGTLNTSSNTVTINGGVNLAGGTFNAQASSITAGSWSLTSGSFNAGTSTVTLTGTTPSLTGSTTFYSLVYNVAGSTLTFAAGSTTTVSSLFQIQGSSMQPVYIRSSSSGQWAYLNLQAIASSSISYINVSDNYASSQTIRAGGSSHDSGHNINWTFGETAPTGLTAQAVNISSITVSWTPPADTTGLTGYELEASTNSTFAPISTFTITSSTSAASLTVSGLSMNTVYYLRADSLWNGNSSSSAYISATTLGVAPSNLTVLWTGPTSAGLAWSPNGAPSGTQYAITGGISVIYTTYTAVVVTGLSPGTSYNFTVSAFGIPTPSVNITTLRNSASFSNGENASYVLGQNNFNSNINGTNQKALSTTGFGSFSFDPVSRRLFSQDMGNNRVMIFDLSSGISNGMNASFVLGQTAWNGRTAATSQSGMNAPSGTAFDPVNQRLFVADSYNNRVLIYDLRQGITNGMNASWVLGQTNFSGSTNGAGQNMLFYPYSVTYDPSMQRLFVGDNSNNRILIFDLSQGIMNGMNASWVLGQSTFTTNTSATSQSGLYYPLGEAFDVASQRLFVSDRSNNRIVVYDLSAGITSGMNASWVLGQADFTSKSFNATGQNNFYYPNNVSFDPASGMLFVVDGNDYRALIFDLSRGITNNMSASVVIGQTNFTNHGTSGTSQNTVSYSYASYYDPGAQEFFIGDTGNNRIMIFQSVTPAPSASAYTNVTSSQITANWTPGGSGAGTVYTVIFSTAASPETNGLSGNRSTSTVNTSFTFQGLNVNTTYYGSVAATISGGSTSAYTSLGSTPTWVVPPQSPVCSPVWASSMTVTWSSGTNPAGTLYTIRTSSDPVFGVLDSTKTTNLSVSISALIPNTTYYAQILATNYAGIPSSTAAAAPVLTQPNAPGAANFSNFAADHLQTNWTANNNPSGTLYYVVLSTAASPGTNGLSANFSSTTVATSALFTGLYGLTTYYAEVQAIGAAGSATGFTTLGSTVTPPVAPPTAAGVLAVTTATVTASWGNSPGAVYYVLSVSTSSANPPTAVAASSNTFVLSATVPGLMSNVTYYTFAQACSITCSSFTTLGSTVTLVNPPLPAAFSNLSADRVTVNWTANNNAPGTLYSAILSTGASPGTNGFSGNKQYTVSQTGAIFANLYANTVYFADVQAIGVTGSSTDFVSMGSTTTPPVAPPAAEGFLSVTTEAITANWGTSPGAAGYVLTISTDSNNPPQSVAGSSATFLTAATVSGLVPNTTYFALAQACSVTCSSYTVLGATATQPNMPVPGSFSSVSVTRFSVSWNANNNPDGTLYVVQVSTDSGYGYIAASSATVLSTASFLSLTPGATYYAHVKTSGFSGVDTEYVSLGSTVTLPIVAPLDSLLSVSSFSVQVGWDLSEGATSYILIASSASDNPPLSVVGSSTTELSTATVTGLVPNTTYFLFLTACGAGSCANYRVLESTITLAALPVAAAYDQVTAGGLRANWGSGGNPSGTLYTVQISTDAWFVYVTTWSVTSSTQASFAGLIPGTMYYGQVKATNAAGIDTGFTSLESVQTPTISAPASGSVLSVSTFGLTVEWTPVISADSYELLVSTSENDPVGTTIVSSITVLSTAAVYGLQPATAYFLFADACSGGACSAYTELASTMTLTPPPLFAWIGSGNWSTAANWFGGIVPGPNDTAIFSNWSNQDCTVDVVPGIGGFQITSDYTGAISFAAGVSSISIGTNGFSQANGVFNAPSGSFVDAGVFTRTGGTFNSGTGTVALASTNSVTFTPGGTFFNNLAIGGPGSDGLVGYWKMDDVNQNGNVIDYSGQGNTGTAANFADSYGYSGSVPTSLRGSDTGSRNFDGTDDYVSVADSSSLKPSVVTVSAWVYLTSLNGITTCGGSSASNPYIVFKRNSRTDYFEGYSLQKVGNNFAFVATSSGGSQDIAVSATTASAGAWYHITGVFHQPNLSIYVNGVLSGTTTHNFPLDYGTRPVFIGRSGECGGSGQENWDTYFPGLIDDVRIYNRALTQQEITALAAGNPPTQTLSGDLTVSGDLTLSGGTLNAAGNSVTVGGSWLNQTAAFTTGGVVTLNGSGAKRILSNEQPFNTLTFNNSGGSWTSNDNLALSGNWNLTAGTYNPGISTVTFTGASPTLTGSTTFYNLAYSVEGGAMIFAAGSTQTVSGLLTLQGSSDNPLSVVSTLAGQPWYLDNSGTNHVSNVEAQDSDADAGQLIVDSPGGIDATGNSHWLFVALPDFTWTDGSGDGKWSNPSNWYGGAVPGPSDTALFSNACTQDCTVDVSTAVGSLTIGSGYGGIIKLDASTLTVTGDFTGAGGTFDGGSGELIVSGTFNGSGGTFTGDAGTVILASTNSATFTPGGASFNNLTIGSYVSTATFTLGGDLVVGGNLTVSSGTLDVSAFNYGISVAASWQMTGGSFIAQGGTVTFNGNTGGTIVSGGQPFNNLTFNGSGGAWMSNDNLALSGNWTMTTGTYNPGTSTVTFTGTTPSLTGNTTFYRLAYSVTGGTITFAAGSTQTVSGLLTLAGAACAPVYVRSSVGSSQAWLTVSGAYSIATVDVADNNASGGLILRAGSGSIDSGDNVGWTFGEPAPVISSETVSTSSITVNWTMSGSTSGLTGYELDVSTSDAFVPISTSTTTTNPDATSLDVSGLSINTTYYLRVIGQWSGELSTSAYVSTPTWANPPLNLSTTSVLPTSVGLTWDANNNPYGTIFVLQQSADGASFGTILSQASTATTVTGLSSNTMYYFRVLAQNFGGVYTAPGNTVSIRTAVGSAPSAAINFKGTPLASSSGLEILFSWSPVATYSDGTAIATGTPVSYNIYRTHNLFNPLSYWTLVDTINTPGPGASSTVTYGPNSAATSVDDTQYYQVCTVVMGKQSLTCTPITSNFANPVNQLIPDYVFLDNSQTAYASIPLTQPLISNQVSVTLSLGSTNETGVLASARLHAYYPATGASADPYNLPNTSMVLPVTGTPASASKGTVSWVQRGVPRNTLSLADSADVTLQMLLSNGQWQNIGSAIYSAAARQVVFPTSQTGSYRTITYASGSGINGILLSVRPRTFSPNGDGINDFVFFDLNNPSNNSASGEIFSLQGTKVADITVLSPLRMRWDGKDYEGRTVPGGIYMYQIFVGQTRVTGTVVVVK
jgi:hypothetical protein